MTKWPTMLNGHQNFWKMNYRLILSILIVIGVWGCKPNDMDNNNPAVRNTVEEQVENPRLFDPNGQTVLTPAANFQPPPCAKIRITPVDDESAGDLMYLWIPFWPTGI